MCFFFFKVCLYVIIIIEFLLVIIKFLVVVKFKFFLKVLMFLLIYIILVLCKDFIGVVNFDIGSLLLIVIINLMFFIFDVEYYVFNLILMF